MTFMIFTPSYTHIQLGTPFWGCTSIQYVGYVSYMQLLWRAARRHSQPATPPWHSSRLLDKIHPLPQSDPLASQCPREIGWIVADEAGRQNAWRLFTTAPIRFHMSTTRTVFLLYDVCTNDSVWTSVQWSYIFVSVFKYLKHFCIIIKIQYCASKCAFGCTRLCCHSPDVVYKRGKYVMLRAFHSRSQFYYRYPCYTFNYLKVSPY